MLRKALILLAAAFALGGCTPKGTVRESGGSAVVIGDTAGKVASVQVEPGTGATDADARNLAGVIAGKLRESGLFSDVLQGPGGDLVVDGRILSLKKVSSSERWMAGALAGEAKVVLKVEFRDASGNPMGSIEVEGSSGNGGPAVAGDTSDAYEQAAEQLAEYIRKHR